MDSPVGCAETCPGSYCMIRCLRTKYRAHRSSDRERFLRPIPASPYPTTPQSPMYNAGETLLSGPQRCERRKSRESSWPSPSCEQRQKTARKPLAVFSFGTPKKVPASRKKKHVVAAGKDFEKSGHAARYSPLSSPTTSSRRHPHCSGVNG